MPAVDSDYQKRYARFLERLRQARADAELSQAEVAKALGKPQSFVSKCESGERRVDVVELSFFADLYRIGDLSYFLK